MEQMEAEEKEEQERERVYQGLDLSMAAISMAKAALREEMESGAARIAIDRADVIHRPTVDDILKVLPDE